MRAPASRPPVLRLRRLRKRGKQAPEQDRRPFTDANGAEPIQQPSHAREESLETDVAPDLLDREPETGDDLH